MISDGHATGVRIWALVAVLIAAPARLAWSAGEAPPVDTSGLPRLDGGWAATNPFRGDPSVQDHAILVGSSVYKQSCARCHGVEGISGGVAPDLRFLEEDPESDGHYAERVRVGVVRDGKIQMPGFEGTLSQEALWAVRTYLDSLPEDF